MQDSETIKAFEVQETQLTLTDRRSVDSVDRKYYLAAVGGWAVWHLKVCHDDQEYNNLGFIGRGADEAEGIQQDVH